MSDKNKFQEMLQLAEFGAKRLEERRSVEFRIFISYTTLLVLALYQLIKQQNPIYDFFGRITQRDPISLELWEGIILYVLALSIHAVYVIWQIGVGIAMDNDSYRRNFYLKESENISRHRLKYDRKSPNPDTEIVIIECYWQQFLHLEKIWKDWSRLLLVWIPTILFIITVDLFIKKSNWNLDACYRILAGLIPILIFFLLGLVAWILKKVKKIGKTKSITNNYGGS